MSKVIDARKKFLKQDDYFGDELLSMTHRGFWEAIEHTMIDTCMTVLNEGEDAWLEFGEIIKEAYAGTIRDEGET